MTRDKLTTLLNRLDRLPLECDGFTRVASYILTINNIDHKVMAGSVLTTEGHIEPHFWIEAGGWTVDYRLRMWAGQEMPHGVFVPPEGVVYHGNPVQIQCSAVLFDILTQGMP